MSRADAMSAADALANSILEAAGRQDWPQVGRLESRWSELVRHGFAGDDGLGREQAIRLKALNDRILETLQAHQRDVAEQRARLSHGDKASKAYLDMAGR